MGTDLVIPGTLPELPDDYEPPEPVRKPKGRGRPPKVHYKPELAIEICTRVAEGETIKSILEEEGKPSYATWHRWVVQYPELRSAYATAREISAYSMEDEALQVARLLLSPTRERAISPAEVNAARALLDQLRWSIERRNSQVFGQKGVVQVAVPIQINTTLDLGQPDAPKAEADTNVYDLSVVREEVQEAVSAREVAYDPEAKPLLNTEEQNQLRAGKPNAGRLNGSVKGRKTRKWGEKFNWSKDDDDDKAAS